MYLIEDYYAKSSKIITKCDMLVIGKYLMYNDMDENYISLYNLFEDIIVEDLIKEESVLWE